MVLVGPDLLFGSELIEYFREENIKVIAPSKKASEMGTSRVALREIMSHYKIPIPAGHLFENMEGALNFCKHAYFPLVIKSDRVGKAKTAICYSFEEVREFLPSVFKGIGGTNHERVIVENFIAGSVVYLPALVDGQEIMPLPYCHIVQNNRLTVGACIFSPLMSEKVKTNLERFILVPWIHALNHSLNQYRGVICLEIVLTTKGPYVVDFKMQWNSIVAVTLLANLESDLVELLQNLMDGSLEKLTLSWFPATIGCVAPSPMPVKVESHELLTADSKTSSAVYIFQEKWQDVPFMESSNFASLLGVSSSGMKIAEAYSSIVDYWQKMRFMPNPYLQRALQSIQDLARIAGKI
jgi:phosphoribosylamine--glycine ligase